MRAPSASVTPLTRRPRATGRRRACRSAPRRRARRWSRGALRRRRGSRFVPTCGCASTRMSGGAPCAHQEREDALDRAPLGRAGVELAVRERARAALAEAVVALRVDEPVAGEPRDVVPPRRARRGRARARSAGCRARSAGAPRRGRPDRRRRRRGRARRARRAARARTTASGRRRLVDPHADAQHVRPASGRAHRASGGSVGDVRDGGRRRPEASRDQVDQRVRVAHAIGRQTYLELARHRRSAPQRHEVDDAHRHHDDPATQNARFAANRMR